MGANRGQRLGKFLAVLCAAFLLGSCGSSDGGGSTSNLLFKNVFLSGAQENPAVTSAATGSGVLTIDGDSGEISGSVETFGITATAAHIHEAAPGVNGGIIIELTQGPPGTWSLPEGARLTGAQLESLRNGNLYVNVHTPANPGGEIRGQIGRQIFFATLTASQENPPTTSTATGTGRFVYDPETRTMSGTVTTTGVTATAGHIHIAAVGSNAGVAVPFTGGPADFTMPSTVLTEAQAASLAAGNFYANVHSATFPGGEIRGQLYLPARFANLTGAQEAPPNNSTATGVGWLVVNPFTRGVAGRVETTGLTSINAHVHRAAAGVAGGVVIPMTQPSASVWVIAPGATLSEELLIALLKNELYFNVHSAAFPAGEIRGQLVLGQ